MASLFAGTPQTAPSYAATTTDVPKWLQDYTVDLFSQQRAVSGTPYQPYALPRIAETTAPTTQSQNLIQSNIGAYQPAVGGAIAGTQGLAGATSVGNVNAYMNPYTQNVTDQIAKLGARNLSENLLPAVSDQFIRAGQFGSSGMGTFGERALRDTQESILANQTNALNTGYTQALGASQADLARQQGALAQTADLAKMQQGLTTADAAALESIGTTQQAQQQKGLDVAYQDYLNQIQYPQTQINNMSTTLRGLPPTAVPTTGTTSGTTTTFAPSPLSALAGAYSLYQGVNTAQAQKALGSAKGGLIQGYANGGAVTSDDDLHASVMADYGQYFNQGGAAPGYADDGLVDTENPADLVAPSYSSPPQRQIEPSGGGYAPPPQTAADRLAGINPELAALMEVYNVGNVDYSADLSANRKAIATERAAYKTALDNMANAGVASGPTDSEKWFSRAAGFFDPGKTGAFSEGLSHVAASEAANAAEQRKANAANAANKAQYGFKGHEVDLESLRDEGKTLQSLQSEQSKGRLAIIQDVIKESIAANKKPPAWAVYELYSEQEKAAGRKPLDWDAYRLEGERAKAPRTTIEMGGEKQYEKTFGEDVAKQDVALKAAAADVPKQLQAAMDIKTLLKQHPITGVGADELLSLNNLLATANLIDPSRGITTETLVATLSGQTLAAIKGSGLGSGQGFTDGDRKFLEKATSGNVTMNAGTLARLADLSERAARHTAEKYNKFVDRTSPSKRKFYGLEKIDILGVTPEPAFH